MAVAALTAALGLAPAAVAAWPTTSDPVSAPSLLARINASTAVGYSGYAQSVGGLSLPITTQFSGLVDLIGGTTQMRVWWQADDRNRVDVVSAVGETDLIRDATGTWQWDYQGAKATRTRVAPDVRVRLPVAGDLLPTELGRRLLSEAEPAEVSRLPVVRIAGRDAPGLRLRPAAPQSSIDHVDVWADPATGLPVRVAVFGTGAATAAVTTSFLDLDTTRPADTQLQFEPPFGTHISYVDGPTQNDLVSAVDRFAPAKPPAILAGLERTDRGEGFGAIGVYGRGVTELVAVPLWGRIAGPLRTQLTATSTTQNPDGSVLLGAGPIGLLLTADQGGGRSWLLAGTVTTATLTAAAAQLTGSDR